MTTPVRISVEEARSKTLSGEAILVCGYDDAEKFKNNNLKGAITWQTFLSRVPEMPKDQEVIFYCA